MFAETDRDAMVETIEAALAGALAAVRALKRSGGPVTSARRMSQVEIATRILEAAGGPLHINRIVEEARASYHRELDRDSLSSALAKQIKPDGSICRPEPNTFAVTIPKSREE
ncbi:MAG: hypothetical protein KGJ62_09560 [Armatimonadetes bacterium]|nr:hypothetical protein [Armatimonadota bacterium]MDE2205808.1 hypothetical protein [Armatimonadota bacterium]